jgi:RNA polymerase sigma-70 factor, ECF subfamily
VSGFGLAAGQFGSPWPAVDQVTREVLAARVALARGLDALRSSIYEMRSIGARPDGGSTSRIQTRLPGNDGSTRHQPPVGTKPAGGRVPSGRQPSPAELTGPTVDLVTPAAPKLADTGTGQFPSRPDPGDPASEVWSLVERAQNGEAEAFGLIYDRYMDTVFRFIYFRVGSRQLAEDLTSDTFLRALKRIGSFTWQGRDLGAWLVTIARNLVADHFKSGRYRLEVTTGDVLDADREDRGPEGSPEAVVVDHITNVTLLSAVKQLNPEQQECIVLRFLQGFSVAETALSMGKNEGAIKALQYRAVRALARLLPEGFQP